MNAWKRKLGLILPSLNTVMEYEMQRMAAGVMSIHTMRISSESERNGPAEREAHLLWMESQVPASARLLAHAKVNVICYGCTGGGVIKGPGHDQAICEQIRATTGIPATTTSSSITAALRTLGVSRISIASPYHTWLNDKLRLYMEESGFEVLAIEGMNTREHAAVTFEQVAQLATRVNRPESHAVLISCTNFRTLEIIEPLEAKLGKPVVTSNSASLWQMLRIAGDHAVIAGAGRLFQER